MMFGIKSKRIMYIPVNILIYINEINDNSQQPKLRTYKLFKTDCRIEPYLALQKSRKVLTKIARFRTSSHSLKIETGRHHKPIIPAPNRICEKCTSNFVEDEIHCLIVCPGNEQHCVKRRSYTAYDAITMR